MGEGAPNPKGPRKQRQMPWQTSPESTTSSQLHWEKGKFQRLGSAWFTPNLKPINRLGWPEEATSTGEGEATGPALAYRFTEQREDQPTRPLKHSKKDYALSLRNPPPGNLPKEGKSCEHKGGHQRVVYRQTLEDLSDKRESWELRCDDVVLDSLAGKV